MIQTWSHIIWAHWPVDPSVVASLLPPGLTPETFDGAAWVGLIPFQMSELRLPGALSGLTSLVGVRSFGEVNVRTRDNVQQGSKPLADFIAQLRALVADHQ